MSVNAQLMALAAAVRTLKEQPGLFAELPYDDRGDIRSADPEQNYMVLIESLGLYTYDPDSEEIDDDETYFSSTYTGGWELTLTSMDLSRAYSQAEQENSIKQVFGTANCSVTTVAGLASVTFSGMVQGAEIGDVALVTPPGSLGDNSTSTGQLDYHAWVSAPNVVSIALTNASSQSATTNPGVRTNWSIIVFKEV